MALKEGIVAHNVQKTKNGFEVSYEKNHWSTFWRDYNEIITLQKNDPVYVFTTIFAPTEIRKPILHRWFKFDNNNEKWLKTDEIQYEIIGGRNKGYRGYTYKENTHPGKWKVEVLTLEEQILGVLKFEIVIKPKQEVNISKSAY
ncbi:DUF2914 domain-containing protein [Brumimicrobium salinarum]|uniref:DUF2914 domain-containing protein n=1 Tax=Brumimicrobium salinarum TaxID=2058658 RepID=UPI0029371FE2|nr:DUF2914 domain-containing protein [Brumimicrobium salinarum]